MYDIYLSVFWIYIFFSGTSGSLKLDPPESVLDPLRAIKRKKWELNVWRTFEDFSGFHLHLRSILNARLWDKGIESLQQTPIFFLLML